jgi:hypothetical protein
MSQDAAGAVPQAAASSVKILIDSPSAKPSPEFEAMASALAQIIRDSRPRFAVGIFGSWGSGKTTLMQEIQRRLATAVVCVEFNAWRYEREPQLLIPLLDTVRGALVEWAAHQDADTRERVRTAAHKVGRIIRGLAAGLSGEVGLLGAVKVSYDVGKSIDVLTASGEPEQPQSLYVAAFRELSQTFADLGAQGVTRIVVFVDDLDRCLPENALDVIESVKLFFDLPGFIFVMGLDQDVVQRAVRTRFPDTPRPASEIGAPASAITREEQLASDYVEKIFQVPYRLPPMVSGQLNSLLEAMYQEAELPPGQLDDFRKHVPDHLRYVAVRGQINPREVKRFLNTYTLQMLVRPNLDRDVVLSLQTLDFRSDWRDLYGAILTDPLLFSRALKDFRGGDDHAFIDLHPDLGTIQDELTGYLRSDAVTALADVDSLDRYLTSLESTGRIPPWLTAAYREVGRLRQETRRIATIQSPDDSDRDALHRIASDVASTLESQISPSSGGFPPALPALVQEIRTVIAPIQPPSPSSVAPPDTQTPADLQQLVKNTSERLDDVATRIYRALRVARSALAPASSAS